MTMAVRVAAACGLLASVVVGWLWVSSEPAGEPADTLHGTAQDRSRVQRPPVGIDTLDTSPSGNTRSPFAVTAETSGTEASTESETQRPESALVARIRPVIEVLAAIDVTQLGRTAIDDTDFDALVLRLRADPALLQRLIDEFRQEQDTERLDLLMRLLGNAGGSEVALLASELVYSGNEQARQLGLQMLQRARPGSAEVQQIASSLLTTEVEPRVLVDTLTTLARPGTVDSENRTLLADQVALMASHPDAGVRGVSLDILSRLSTDGRDTPVLLAGLADSDARVRESAAYALVDHENGTRLVSDTLLQLARNTQEPKATRSAALMALRSLSLPDEQQAELPLLQRQLNTVQRVP